MSQEREPKINPFRKIRVSAMAGWHRVARAIFEVPLAWQFLHSPEAVLRRDGREDIHGRRLLEDKLFISNDGTIIFPNLKAGDRVVLATGNSQSLKT